MSNNLLRSSDWRIHTLCLRHGITVEGIVALVDDVMTDSVPTGRWDIYYLRRLARGEEA